VWSLVRILFLRVAAKFGIIRFRHQAGNQSRLPVDDQDIEQAFFTLHAANCLQYRISGVPPGMTPPRGIRSFYCYCSRAPGYEAIVDSRLEGLLPLISSRQIHLRQCHAGRGQYPDCQNSKQQESYSNYVTCEAALLDTCRAHNRVGSWENGAVVVHIRGTKSCRQFCTRARCSRHICAGGRRMVYPLSGTRSAAAFCWTVTRQPWRNVSCAPFKCFYNIGNLLRARPSEILIEDAMKRAQAVLFRYGTDLRRFQVLSTVILG